MESVRNVRPPSSCHTRANLPVPINTRSSKSAFLLILRQPPGGAPPAAELKKIMAEFQAWMELLQAENLVIGTNGLDSTGKVLRGVNGLSITDGPYVEAKEIVGGYVLIAANSFDDALTAARKCPGLAYEMSVEVRTVMQRG
jgi:hypothetical protein